MEKEQDEAQLAALACAGDVEALSVLIERYRLTLFQTAYAELHRYDDAQDAVAEAVVRVCRYAARGGGIGDFRPWIHRVVRNEARRLRFRVENRRETILEENQPNDHQRDISACDLSIEVGLALRRLPSEHARVMAMFYLDGMPVADIAKALSRPVGTIKWLLSRGRTGLSQILEGYETMKSDEPNKSIIALAMPSFSPEYRRELANALLADGWDDVRAISDSDSLLNFPRSNPGEFTIPAVLEGCRLVVIEEHIGRASAFEVLPLLAATRGRCDFAVLLLLDAGRGPVEKNAAVLSAYVSGVDMLLTKPFAIAELRSFAGHVLKNVPCVNLG